MQMGQDATQRTPPSSAVHSYMTPSEHVRSPSGSASLQVFAHVELHSRVPSTSMQPPDGEAEASGAKKGSLGVSPASVASASPTPQYPTGSGALSSLQPALIATAIAAANAASSRRSVVITSS
jgi:hypothetical protein